MGEDPGKEQRVKWGWGLEGRCPGRGGRIPGGGCGPFCRHGESRPQDSMHCSWSELKHTQGSPQQLQEGRGLAHTSASFILLTRKELRANTVKIALFPLSPVYMKLSVVNFQKMQMCIPAM